MYLLLIFLEYKHTATNSTLRYIGMKEVGNQVITI